MKVKARFCAYIRERDEFLCIDENALQTNFQLYRERLLNLDIDGLISITKLANPDITIRIQDDLCAIVQNLCFIAIQDLSAIKSTIVRIYSNYGFIRFYTNENSVTISGDVQSDIIVDRINLILELYECGKRFMMFFKMLKGDDPDYKDIIEELERHAHIADECLKNRRIA